MKETRGKMSLMDKGGVRGGQIPKMRSFFTSNASEAVVKAQ